MISYRGATDTPNHWSNVGQCYVMAFQYTGILLPYQYQYFACDPFSLLLMQKGTQINRKKKKSENDYMSMEILYSMQTLIRLLRINAIQLVAHCVWDKQKLVTP